MTKPESILFDKIMACLADPANKGKSREEAEKLIREALETRTPLMSVYDCFTFFNELDLLEIRFAELAGVVDTFVIVEATTTFQGKPKPLYFQENRARFSAFDKQICHIIVDDMPSTDNPWEREYHQRNAIKRGLTDATPDSLVVISDADEIYPTSAVRELQSRKTFTYLQQRLFAYFLNCELLECADVPSIKVYGGPWRDIQKIDDLSAPRYNRFAAYNGRLWKYLRAAGLVSDETSHLVKNGGWHFSSLGGVDRLITKLESFSHTEPSTMRSCEEAKQNPNLIMEAIAKGRLIGTDFKLCIRPVDQGFPDSIRKFQDRYLKEKLLWQVQA